MKALIAQNLTDEELTHYAELEPAAAAVLAERVSGGTFVSPEHAAAEKGADDQAAEAYGEGAAYAEEYESKLQRLTDAVEAVLPDLDHYAVTHGPGPDKRLAALRAVLDS